MTDKKHNEALALVTKGIETCIQSETSKASAVKDFLDAGKLANISSKSEAEALILEIETVHTDFKKHPRYEKGFRVDAKLWVQSHAVYAPVQKALKDAGLTQNKLTNAVRSACSQLARGKATSVAQAVKIVLSKSTKTDLELGQEKLAWLVKHGFLVRQDGALVLANGLTLPEEAPVAAPVAPVAAPVPAPVAAPAPAQEIDVAAAIANLQNQIGSLAALVQK